MTDNPKRRLILAKEVEFTLEDMLKVDIQPWHVPHTTTVPTQPEGTLIDICESHVESDDASFTLPVRVTGTTCNTIIDTGAAVSIVNYECWCKWGSPKMLPSDVKLRMADGSIQRPEGMIPAHNFTIHGVEFNLTFVVTRSSNHVAYECLLGR